MDLKDNEILKMLFCGLSTSNNEHICEEPIRLSCDHCVCKTCLLPGVDQKTIKCYNCQIDKELDQSKDPIMFKFILNQQLATAFKFVSNQFESKFNTLKQIAENPNERIDLKVEFIKEQIEIKVENIKIEIDQLVKSFHKELDELKSNWKNEENKIDLSEYKEDEFKNDLIELNKTVETNQNSTEANLYFYQNKINKLKKLIESIEKSEPILEFQESEIKIKNYLIGQINFKDSDYSSFILNRIKENKFEHLNVITKSS